MLRFTAFVTESEGREVYTIALTVQIMIDPARRSYDDETKRAPGGAVRRARALGGHHAQLPLGRARRAGARVHRRHRRSASRSRRNYDLELAAVKYLYSLPDGDVPLTFNFTGTIFYRGEAGRMQIVQVPWNCSARYAMPVATWRGDDGPLLPRRRLDSR